MRYVRADTEPFALPAARADAIPAVDQDDPEAVGAFGGGERGDQRPQQLGASTAGRALDQQVRSLGREVDGDRAARPGAQHGLCSSAEGLESSAAAAHLAIREAGVARARPSSSRSRAAWGSGADTRAWRSPVAPSARSGASARANRSAQARRRRRPCRGVPCPTGPAGGGWSGLGALGALALRPPGKAPVRADAQQPQCRRHVAAEQRHGTALPEHRRHRAGRLVGLRHRGGRRGRGGLGGGTRRGCRPRGPSRASRAIASRTSAPPGSPSTTTTVYGRRSRRPGRPVVGPRPGGAAGRRRPLLLPGRPRDLLRGRPSGRLAWDPPSGRLWLLGARLRGGLRGGRPGERLVWDPPVGGGASGCMSARLPRPAARPVWRDRPSDGFRGSSRRGRLWLLGARLPVRAARPVAGVGRHGISPVCKRCVESRRRGGACKNSLSTLQCPALNKPRVAPLRRSGQLGRDRGSRRPGSRPKCPSGGPPGGGGVSWARAVRLLCGRRRRRRRQSWPCPRHSWATNPARTIRRPARRADGTVQADQD